MIFPCLHLPVPKQLLISTAPPYCYDITHVHVHTHLSILSCVSYNSPPTNVIWERDGERIYFNDTSYAQYQSSQMLMNRTTSAYNNTLTINATIEDVIGEYSCTMTNSFGSSSKLKMDVKCMKCNL